MRYVESELYDIRGINRVILSLAIFTVVLTAAVAGLIPAQRAASIDPAYVLDGVTNWKLRAEAQMALSGQRAH